MWIFGWGIGTQTEFLNSNFANLDGIRETLMDWPWHHPLAFRLVVRPSDIYVDGGLFSFRHMYGKENIEGFQNYFLYIFFLSVSNWIRKIRVYSLELGLFGLNFSFLTFSCVIFGKLLNPSVPQCDYLYNEDNTMLSD